MDENRIGALMAVLMKRAIEEEGILQLYGGAGSMGVAVTSHKTDPPKSLCSLSKATLELALEAAVEELGIEVQ